jgi:hypothetical protein
MARQPRERRTRTPRGFPRPPVPAGSPQPAPLPGVRTAQSISCCSIVSANI